MVHIYTHTNRIGAVHSIVFAGFSADSLRGECESQKPSNLFARFLCMTIRLCLCLCLLLISTVGDACWSHPNCLSPDLFINLYPHSHAHPIYLYWCMIRVHVQTDRSHCWLREQVHHHGRRRCVSFSCSLTNWLMAAEYRHNLKWFGVNCRLVNQHLYRSRILDDSFLCHCITSFNSS